MAFGQAICAKIELGPYGEKAVMDNLNQLKAFSSFGDLIWFGVGVKHILRTIVQTSEGCSLVALAGALSECFPARTGALVFYELSRILKAPSELSPSLAQWEKLLQCCSSVFKGSTFSLKLEHFLSASRLRETPAVYEKNPGHPQDLARILLALGQVTRRELKNITVQGSVSCCWLATYAIHVLGLRVDLYSDSNLLYRNYEHSHSDAQLRIHLTSYDHLSTELCALKTSFTVRDGYKFVAQWYHTPKHLFETTFTTFLGGDLCWDTLLHDVFPVEAKILLDTPNSAVFESFCSLFQTGLEILGRSTACFTTPRSHSPNSTMPTNVLTELHVIDRCPTRAWLHKTTLELLEIYENIIYELRDLESTLHCHSSAIADGCLPDLAEMIIGLSFLLNICEITSNLKPKRSALRRFYYKIFHGRRLSALPGKVEFHGIDILVEHLTFGGFGHDSKSYNLLNLFILLFTGNEIRAPPEDKFPSACSAAGVFCYLNGLTSLSTDYAKSIQVIVGAGAIECRSRTYDFVFDLNSTSDDAQPYSTEVVNTANGFDVLWNDMPHSDLEVEAVVEDIQYLLFYYQVKSSKGRVVLSPASFIYRRLLPSTLIKSTAELEQHSTLSRREFSKLNIPLVVASGEGPAQAKGSGLILRPHRNNLLGQCVALSWRPWKTVLVTNDVELDSFLAWFASVYKRESRTDGQTLMYDIISC